MEMKSVFQLGQNYVVILRTTTMITYVGPYIARSDILKLISFEAKCNINEALFTSYLDYSFVRGKESFSIGKHISVKILFRMTILYSRFYIRLNWISSVNFVNRIHTQFLGWPFVRASNVEGSKILYQYSGVKITWQNLKQN